jgi:hypothetical protein
MRDAGQPREFAFGVLGVEKVDGDMPVARPIRFSSARQSDDLPAALLQ